MSKVTFVVDFEDGKEPAVHAGMTIFGGSLVAVSWRDALEVAEKRVLLPEHENVHYADAAEMEIAELRQRIAELEARTLTVKLPEPKNSICSDWNGGFESAMQLAHDRIKLACSVAGIKLQIEGE